MRCVLVSRQFSTIDKPFSYVIRSENSCNTSKFLQTQDFLLDILVKKVSQAPLTYSCHIGNGKTRIWREVVEAGSCILDDAI